MSTAPAPRPAGMQPAVRPPSATNTPSAPMGTADIGDMFGPAPAVKKGMFVVIGGPPKYGKTTFAAGAPRPVFILADRNGLDGLPASIPRTVPETWDDIVSAAQALATKPHDFGAVVLDHIFRAESMLIKHLITKSKVDSFRKVGGGYKTPSEWLEAEINRLLEAFFALNARGVHTIAISQVKVGATKDATVDDYEKTALAVSKDSALLWAAAAHVNMYVQPEIREFDRIEGQKEDRVKVEFTGKAICHVSPAKGIEAGNRYMLKSPMAYSWAALEIGRDEGEDIRARLQEKLGTLDMFDRANADIKLNASGWSREAALQIINS